MLFLNMGIVPDVLLGCSTGEFAAITMGGAIDISAAAPLFYHLSTSISKALPFDRLLNLQSLKINAPFSAVASYLAKLKGKVHLGADLSNKQLLVTGDKESINLLVRIPRGRWHISRFFTFCYSVPHVASGKCSLS